MKLGDLVWIMALAACKPSAEKCFEARDKASAAWLEAAATARAEDAKGEGAASDKMLAALDLRKQIPVALWPCLVSRAVATGETLDLDYVAGAPDEVRKRIATGRQVSLLPSANEAAKAAIAKASGELETALPELEKQANAAKPGKPSAAFMATAKRIDTACTELLTHS